MTDKEDTLHTFDSEGIELYILKSLFDNDAFARNFTSKIKPEHFSENIQGIIKSYLMFFNKKHCVPPLQFFENVVLPKVLRNEKELENAKIVLENIQSLSLPSEKSFEWLIEETKKFIKQRVLILAVMKSIDLIQSHKYDDVVSIFDNANRMDFDESIGLDYFAKFDERMLKNEDDDVVYKTGVPCLDDLVGGGYRKKSMFVYAGPANSGKTLILNDAATNLVMQGLNVLYVTLEISETHIAKRSDAKFSGVNLCDKSLSSKDRIEKAKIKLQMMSEKGKKPGKLIYKEYSPGSVCSNDIHALMKNLEVKMSVKIDVVVIDYLKLVRPNGRAFADNTYGRLQTVSEELRAIAMEHNVIVLTAAQTGRQSYGAKSSGMEDIADSIGIAQTADVVVNIGRPKDLEESNEMTLSISKSRFSKNCGMCIVTVNYEQQKLIDMNNGKQTNNQKENKAEKLSAFSEKNISKNNDKEVLDKQIDI